MVTGVMEIAESGITAELEVELTVTVKDPVPPNTVIITNPED